MCVDLDDTVVEVHGYQKQGAGFGYSGVRGLNVLLATVSMSSSAPVILAQRLRKGAAGSPRGAARIVADALATLRSVNPESGSRGCWSAPTPRSMGTRPSAPRSQPARTCPSPSGGTRR